MQKELALEYVTINRYAKANNKYMKDYDKNKELLHLKYWDVNILYGCMVEQYHKKFPVNGLNQVGELFEFNEDFIKSYHE